MSRVGVRARLLAADRPLSSRGGPSPVRSRLLLPDYSPRLDSQAVYRSLPQTEHDGIESLLRCIALEDGSDQRTETLLICATSRSRS